MISKTILICNNIGLHARPAAMIAAEASRMDSRILLRCKGLIADAKNSARILAMAVGNGDRVEVTVCGVDEENAMSCMTRLFDEINANNC